jgi:hypothetical protein
MNFNQPRGELEYAPAAESQQTPRSIFLFVASSQTQRAAPFAFFQA